jgi:hypothetical protein
MTPLISVTLPIRTESANMGYREHFYARHRRIKAQKTAVLAALGPLGRPALPVTVTLTRISPGRVDDDNLRWACKGIRDAVAKWLGVDDASPRVTWQYEQEQRATATMHSFDRSGNMKTARAMFVRIAVEAP